MLIKSVHIENYRCILETTVDFDDLTIMVGANGAGKSTILRAIDQFLSSNPSITEDDFYAGDSTREIIISLIFTSLSEGANERFKKYLHQDELTVDMVVLWDGDKPNIKYHGSRLQNPDFAPIYTSTNKVDARKQYNELRQQNEYKNLPSARNYDEVELALQTWEESNPDKCKRMRDDGRFFGFKEVGHGYLRHHSQFIFVSAVRDASEDSEEGRGSVITQIMDIVVRKALVDREDLTQFKQDVASQYQEMLKPDNLGELTALRDQLSSTLQTFVPNAAVELDWQPLEPLNIPMPKANIGLVEDGYGTKVYKAGHGLQRAFIFTMLQHLALAQRPEPEAKEETTGEGQDFDDNESPAFIIAIEEPELYQHPNRQRYFARVLRKLAEGELSGVVRDIQVIFATHSPLFIDISHFDEIRLIRKVLPDETSLPKTTRVNKAVHDDIVQEVRKLKNNPQFSLATLMPQLMTPSINEGFFADLVVVVEGGSDCAVLQEVASQCNWDLESMGISMVSTGGKPNLLIPSVIFKRLGIPVYVVWDCDQKADNGDLFNFVSFEPVDSAGLKSEIPYTDLIEPHFAAFHSNREDTMKREVGKDLFRRLIRQCKSELDSVELRKPVVAQRFTQLVYEHGQSLPSLESILRNVVAMRNQHQ